MKKFALIKNHSNSNAGGIFSVVNSIDYPDRPSRAEQTDFVRTAIKQAPLDRSSALSYSATWEDLQLDPDPVPTMSINH